MVQEPDIRPVSVVHGDAPSTVIKTAILYARVSTTKQAKEYGLDSQLDDLRAWAKREGYTVLAEFTDEGGKHSKRDTDPWNLRGFAGVLQRVAMGGVGVVIATERLRYGQDWRPGYIQDVYLAPYGTKLLPTTGNIYGDAVMDAASGDEREKTKRRTRNGKLRKARTGSVVALGQPNYGYVYTQSRDAYELAPSHMRVVERIFRMVGLEGASLHEVKRALDNEGWPTPSHVWSDYTAAKRARKGLEPKKFSQHWSGPFIRGAITDDVYKEHTREEIDALVAKGHMTPEVAARAPEPCGIWWYVGHDFTGNRHAVAVPVPASGIPTEWVDAARLRIKDNVKTMPGGGSRAWELGGGIFRCECGWTMQGHSRKGWQGNTYHSYRCSRRSKHGKDACAVITNYNAREVEDEVWALVSGRLSDPVRIVADIDRLIEAERARMMVDPQREEMALLSRKAELESERRGYLKQNARGVLSDAELDEMLSGVEESRQEIGRSIERLRSRGERLRLLEHRRRSYAEPEAWARDWIDDWRRDYPETMTGATEESIDKGARILAGALGPVQHKARRENLDALGPEQRREQYRRHGIRVTAREDGTLDVSGEILPSGMCTFENASRSRGRRVSCG